MAMQLLSYIFKRCMDREGGQRLGGTEDPRGTWSWGIRLDRRTRRSRRKTGEVEKEDVERPRDPSHEKNALNSDDRAEELHRIKMADREERRRLEALEKEEKRERIRKENEERKFEGGARRDAGPIPSVSGSLAAQDEGVQDALNTLNQRKGRGDDLVMALLEFAQNIITCLNLKFNE